MAEPPKLLMPLFSCIYPSFATKTGLPTFCPSWAPVPLAAVSNQPADVLLAISLARRAPFSSQFLSPPRRSKTMQVALSIAVILVALSAAAPGGCPRAQAPAAFQAVPPPQEPPAWQQLKGSHPSLQAMTSSMPTILHRPPHLCRGGGEQAQLVLLWRVN